MAMARELVETTQLQADVKRYHETFVALGLPANPAAAMAMKWATKTSVPVDVDACLQRCTENPLTTSAVQAVQDDLRNLFRNGDTLYMSLLLFSNNVQQVSTAAPDTQTPRPTTSGRLDMHKIFAAMQSIFAALQAAGHDDAAFNAVERLLTGSLEESLRWVTADVQAALLIGLLLMPPLESVEHLDDIMVPLLRVMEASRHVCAAQLYAEFALLGPALLKHAVFVLQQFMTIRLYRTRMLDSHISSCCNLMQVLYDANQQLDDPIDYTDFYNDVVNSADFNLEEDFKRWRSDGPPQFCFCRFPFLYGPAAKAKLLMYDNVEHQMGEIASVLFSHGSMGSGRPYLVLNVRRGPDMMHDALTQIRSALSTDSLRKPLKVKFVGEQGVDEGGVAKEFFNLVMRDCFSPNYGMFTVCSSARAHWFLPSELSDLSGEFELIGIIIGLAIYNAHILEFTFPMAIYKKLLSRAVGLTDLKDLHSDIHASLLKLLEYPESQVEADMGLTFQIEREVDFCIKQYDLVPNGSSIPVTGKNRQDFVNQYVDFLLNGSTRTQFKAFQSGFRRLCSGPVMDMFNPKELELLICGSPEFNFDELQRSTIYDGGYTADSDIIKWFWKAVHEYGEDDKKLLLSFVTSSHRVPINGLSALSPPFCISRNGPHTDRLPTAHTCFNILLLPQYSTEQDMRARLKLALDNGEGFGLM